MEEPENKGRADKNRHVEPRGFGIQGAQGAQGGGVWGIPPWGRVRGEGATGIAVPWKVSGNFTQKELTEQVKNATFMALPPQGVATAWVLQHQSG